MLSFTSLYILFVLVSALLFNALILLARYVRQTKQAPEEEDYQRIEENCRELESTIEKQNQEIVELQMKIKDLKGEDDQAEEASETAENVQEQEQEEVTV